MRRNPSRKDDSKRLRAMKKSQSEAEKIFEAILEFLENRKSLKAVRAEIVAAKQSKTIRHELEKLIKSNIGESRTAEAIRDCFNGAYKIAA